MSVGKEFSLRWKWDCLRLGLFNPENNEIYENCPFNENPREPIVYTDLHNLIGSLGAFYWAVDLTCVVWWWIDWSGTVSNIADFRGNFMHFNLNFYNFCFIPFCLIFFPVKLLPKSNNFDMHLPSWWLRRSRIYLQCRSPRFNPWVRKIPWRRERQPSLVFWPGEFHELYGPWGHKESTGLSNFQFHCWAEYVT